MQSGSLLTILALLLLLGVMACAMKPPTVYCTKCGTKKVRREAEGYSWETGERNTYLACERCKK